MRSKAKPVLSFRVYPERKSLYFTVHIWRTFGQLRAIARRRRIKKFRRTAAFVSSFTRYKVASDAEIAQGKPAIRCRPQCGEIHISLKDLSVEVVSHECSHAALHWASRMGFVSRLVDRSPSGDASEHEERYCYAQGRMAQQIADRLYAAGFYGRRKE